MNVAFFTVMLFVPPPEKHQRQHVRHRQSPGTKREQEALAFCFLIFLKVQWQVLDTCTRHYLVTSFWFLKSLNQTYEAEGNHNRAVP